MDSCSSCGFALWLPIASLKASKLGLYSDSRFKGRAILKLNAHEEQLEGLSDELALAFLQDSKVAMTAIQNAVGAERVNFAVLGDTVAHVHAHLIPRFPAAESFPGSMERSSTPGALSSRRRVRYYPSYPVRAGATVGNFSHLKPACRVKLIASSTF